jgi:hypothetical protein
MAPLGRVSANLEPVDLKLPNLEMPKLKPRGRALSRKPAVSLGVLLESESKAALLVGEPLVKRRPA